MKGIVLSAIITLVCGYTITQDLPRASNPDAANRTYIAELEPRPEVSMEIQSVKIDTIHSQYFFLCFSRHF